MAARSLLSSLPSQITHQHLTALQSSFLTTSSRFASYNFREYFIRRSNLKFQQELPLLIGAKEINDSVLSEVNSTTRERLNKWWKESVQELAVLERASAMNKLFEGPRLVVEGIGNVMTDGGGGAGMEQSQGGAGHPNKPGDTIRSLFPSPSDSKSES